MKDSINTAIKNAFLRQSLRREIRRKIPSKNNRSTIREANLYSTFVEPFTDVLQAVNLASQDFLNSYITYLRMYITFSPERGKELLADHDKRKAKIAEKWKPLMEKTDAALSSGDADVIALVLAPHAFALGVVGEKVVEYSGGVKDFLDNTGMGNILSVLPGLTFLSDSETKEKEKEKDSSMSLIDKLSIVFFGAYAGRTLQLSYQKQQADAKVAALKGNQNEGVLKEEKKNVSFSKDFEKFMNDTGLDEVFQNDADELMTIFKETIKEFDEEYETKTNLIKSIQEATDLETFVKSFDETQTSQSSLSETEILSEEESNLPDPAKVRNDIEKAVQDLAKSEEFIKKTKEAAGQEDVSAESIKIAAEKVIFLDSVKTFEEEVGGFDNSIEELKNTIGKNLSEIMPTDASLAILKKSKNPKAKKALELIEKTKQKYSIK